MMHFQTMGPADQSSNNHDEIEGNVSGELYEVEDTEAPVLNNNVATLKLAFNTVLKEPPVPKSLPAHVDLLTAVQHFDSENWSSVRYSEVQKLYCSQPAFTELETNDELKPFDKFSNLSVLERGFAAITQALIKQGETVESCFDSLVTWARTTPKLTPESLQDKIKELFIEGPFQKISNDVLQLACGHRADLIQQRRDSILRSVKDKYFKESLRKIPPSPQFIFQKDPLSSAIEKQGGVSKCFWPVRPPTQNKPAAQAGPNQTNNAQKAPAQDAYDPSGLLITMPRPFLPVPAQGNYNFVPTA
ncbi:uncharacterized protein LOC133525238 isoform X1 [Cydia pomonella]|uniref:uncharacterized protein LOC133525238 isoform X1 n=1 Tax=Cydia pomonella TaxID=82600 RepID=UPI002ADE706F|nr:uncharacterized protein LOC133525238 isoform X1 [Cydia pomonella]XP_061717515.1 uncharacterized protein LOC133525238 isoform X1 [Cydia pomonella]XP_061717517.1 uncharacterized protein LOC133525238 isoform X1 [Cydia pomonella]XP_061717518.1 uncharacterized protein LOC133525238 isoform X1 [Cydia pomonella]XP_061717519.1 uncharacterized protein LOC133525238 isoform X1 [Cydia pomonella]XP_061717520.1 uncharacterized protein LOC133525238 isoform X1 [Cydia pomonella]